MDVSIAALAKMCCRYLSFGSRSHNGARRVHLEKIQVGMIQPLLCVFVWPKGMRNEEAELSGGV